MLNAEREAVHCISCATKQTNTNLLRLSLLTDHEGWQQDLEPAISGLLLTCMMECDLELSEFAPVLPVLRLALLCSISCWMMSSSLTSTSCEQPWASL